MSGTTTTEIQALIDQAVEKAVERLKAPGYMGREQASRYAATPAVTMDAARRSGDLAFSQIGRKIIMSKSSIDTWLAAHAVEVAK